MPVQHRHRATVLAALCALLLSGCSLTSEPVNTAGIPATLPAPAPHGPYAPEDAARAEELKRWATSNADSGQKTAATRVRAVQIVESGDTQHVYLHTDLPHTNGTPPEQTANLFAVYEAWPNRPATAVRIGAFDADGHRFGTAGVPLPTPSAG